MVLIAAVIRNCLALFDGAEKEARPRKSELIGGHMRTRRVVLEGLAGVVALAGSGPFARAAEEDLPVAKLIKGTPSILDYSGGVQVPVSRDAFYTLWEGDRFWLTFGFGIAPQFDIAKKFADKQSLNLMKFMLLTLAFAPARLIKVNGGGWRKKDPSAHDFVIGELPLPAQHTNAMTDAFLGAGNVVITPFLDTPAFNDPRTWPATMRCAFAATVVMKKDMSLDNVRKRAAIL